MAKTKVAVAVPVARAQEFTWWHPLVVRCLQWERQGIELDVIVGRAAMPDMSKNIIAGGAMNGNNGRLTHENRNDIIPKFEESGAEWLLFIDDDTPPVLDLLPRLLALDKPFVGGVYYHRDDRAAPLIYRRTDSGMYAPLVNFEKGALMPVDAMGLGCALIHKSVFEKIRENYRLMRRKRGSFFIMHQDDFRRAKMPRFLADQPTIYDDGRQMWMAEPVHDAEAEFSDRPFPYFDMESGRTEDIGFCERAQRVGFEIWVDTTLECKHNGVHGFGSERFDELRDEALVAGVRLEEGQ